MRKGYDSCSVYVCEYIIGMPISVIMLAATPFMLLT